MKTVARPSDKAEILRRLRVVGPDRRARWGRMSAHQMICHLSDSFRMATGQKPVREAGGLFHRTFLKWIVLYPAPAMAGGNPDDAGNRSGNRRHQAGRFRSGRRGARGAFRTHHDAI